MPDLLQILTTLAWPIALALAWIVGEFGQRWTGLPRISFYGLVGFALAYTQIGALPPTESLPVLALAELAFGLMLFELGYRINVRWFVTNPWLGAAGVVETAATFVAVYFTAVALGTPSRTALMVGALAMATSPATVVRIVNEMRSSGQVTERVMHLTALNTVLAVFAFNVVLAFGANHAASGVTQAVLESLVLLLLSVLTGAVFGMAVPAVLRQLGNMAEDATVAFALSVVLLVAITYSTGLFPIIAALTFGLVARHRRVAFSKAQRNFGPLGDILTVLLFVYASATLDWRQVSAGFALALAVVAVRLLTKTAGVLVFSPLTGVTWRKGALTGFALAPLSVFVIMVLEDARLRGISVAEELRAMAAVTMLLEVFGPIIIQRALVWARETPRRRDAA
jgi:Kef-type K+ transport system membrane component KefB